MTSKILVADDSITIQKIVAMAFENEDAVVEGIGNGKAAFEKLKKFTPDVVLADVDMPGYNGFELSRKIKESPEFKSVSVLLLASDFEDFNEGLFVESQADDHISKPFKSDDIVQKVHELLQHPPATLHDGDLPNEKDEIWDDDEEEEILSLSENDMVEESDILELDTKDIETPSSEQTAMEQAFAEPDGNDYSEAVEPVHSIEPSDESSLLQDSQSEEMTEEAPWEIAETKKESVELVWEATAENTEENSRNTFDSEKAQEDWKVDASDNVPIAHDFSHFDAASGDPLVAFSTDDEDMEFHLLPLDVAKKKDESERTADFNPANDIPTPLPDQQELPTFEAGSVENTMAEKEKEEVSGIDGPESPTRPVTPEAKAIDEAIDAVNALKEYSASMLDEPDTGLGIGFQSVEIKGEPESFEEKDFDPTLDLELPTHESPSESETFASGDSDFGIGLGLPPEQNASHSNDWDEDELLSGIGESKEQDLGELDVVFHPIAGKSHGPRSWEGTNGDKDSGDRDWDFEEAITPEPEDLLSNLVLHPLPYQTESSQHDLITESSPQNSSSFMNEDSREEESSLEIIQRPQVEKPVPEQVEEVTSKPIEQETPEEEEIYKMDNDRFTETVNAEVRKILEQSIGASIEKEVSGLSATIVRSVREIVREITPGIAEAVIKEEIDKIKKMEDA